jgi:DNA modification methylase
MSVQLLHGDCLELMSNIPTASIDMILCDLPYGITACKWDTVIQFDQLWNHYKRVIKPNGAIVLFGSQPFTSALIMSNPKWFKYEWIWEKSRGSNFAATKYMPMKEHEHILVFAKNKTTYNPILQQRIDGGRERLSRAYNPTGKVYEIYGGIVDKKRNTHDPLMRCPRSIQKFHSDRGLHPTQKPVALCEYLIKTYTNEGETVLDNCMGSGTTGVACINTNRKFIGIEKEEKYFNIAEKRINEAKYNHIDLFTLSENTLHLSM